MQVGYNPKTAASYNILLGLLLAVHAAAAAPATQESSNHLSLSPQGPHLRHSHLF